MSTARDIIREVRDQLDDREPPFRWNDDELFRYVKAGERQIVTLVPEANIVEELVTPDGPGSRQTVPPGGVKFIKVNCNATTDPVARGATVRYAEKDAIDSLDPSWESAASTAIDLSYGDYYKNYMHDPREPRVYYLYPAPEDPADRAYYLVFCQIPAAPADVNKDLTLDDSYYNALVDFTLYKALTKEGRNSGSTMEAERLWENFLRSLGIKSSAQRSVSPEIYRPPEAG